MDSALRQEATRLAQPGQTAHPLRRAEQPRVPNAETRAVLQRVYEGKDVIEYDSLDDLIASVSEEG